jgi:hypothetical protein
LGEPFQIMFTLRLPDEFSKVILLGVDRDNNCLFSCQFKLSNGILNLKTDVSYYPKRLLKYIEKKKPLIEAGYYEVRTWEVTLFDNQIKERMKFEQSTQLDHKNRVSCASKSFVTVKRKPQLDEFEWEEINSTLLESLEYEEPVVITIFEASKSIETIGPVVVSKVDTLQKILYVSEMGKKRQLPFSKVVGAEKI